MKSVRAILFCLSVLLLTACVPELVPQRPTGVVLTLVCDDAVRTKADDATEKGVRSYHENLISWVDFYFFTGANPGPDATSRLHYHLRSGEQDSASFQMNFTATAMEELFPEGGDNKMTVLAIANYPGDEITAAEHPTFAALDAIRVSTDFVSPTDHRQPRFMMRGVGVLELIDRQEDLVCEGTIRLERYASKMTVSVHVADTVQLAWVKGSNNVSAPEVWRPMLDGMEVYLEDGVNSVRLGGLDTTASIQYFTYDKNRMRFVSKDRQGNLSPLVKWEAGYYETYPMYMYPQIWERGSVQKPTKEPSLKLIIPWYREEYDDTVNDIHITPTQKQCYYKVMMPNDFGNQFLSNRWYYIRLDVKILGALTEETPVPIEGSSIIAYWQDRDVVVKQAEVGKAHYLSVDREVWEISNLNELDIPYVSSHPVTIDSIYVTRPYFGNLDAGKPTLGGEVIDSAGTKFLKYDEAHRKAISLSTRGVNEDWLSDAGGTVAFRHVLNNDYLSSLFDYSPYTITFRLKHADNETYQQEVKIIQYPAIYISRIRNSDPVEEDGKIIANHTSTQTSAAFSKYFGFVFVDGAWKYENDAFVFHDGWQQGRSKQQDSAFYKLNNYAEKKDYQWRSVNYTGGSIDMYNIHISVLPSEFGFVLGDPRTTEIETLGYHFDVPTTNNSTWKLTSRTNFSEAPAMYGLRRRTLAFYYPTEASTRTRDMLAPSYRVCSKFGGIEFGSDSQAGNIGNLDLDHARYRCATYQEDGFPAGRWRIPTEAEVSFIAQLSANGTFEVLFNENGVYWSANSAVKVSKVSTNPVRYEVVPVTDTKAMLRCVYDTWYWGEDQSEYEEWRRRYASPGKYPHDLFVWGDRPR